MFLLLVAVLTIFIFILIIPFTQELSNWLLPVGICVQVAKYDVERLVERGRGYINKLHYGVQQ